MRVSTAWLTFDTRPIDDIMAACRPGFIPSQEDWDLYCGAICRPAMDYMRTIPYVWYDEEPWERTHDENTLTPKLAEHILYAHTGIKGWRVTFDRTRCMLVIDFPPKPQ